MLGSSSLLAISNVFGQRRIVLNWAAYVIVEGIRVGCEKEGKEEKGEKKDLAGTIERLRKKGTQKKR